MFKKSDVILSAGRAQIFYIALILLFLSTAAWGQNNGVLTTFSPGLRSFLTNHPEDFQALTNILSEAFTNRSVRFYYFYSDDVSAPRAEHFYPDYWEVLITVEANQQPVDEFFCVIFESLNSEGQERFAELASEAQSGTISKTNFVMGILKQEFAMAKRTRDLVKKLKFSKQEIAASYYYKEILETPDRFEDTLVDLKGTNTYRQNAIKSYEEKYDLLRSNNSTNQSPP